MQAPFFQYYFTGAVSNAFQHLYDNKRGLQDQFVNYWKQVASTFKENPFVLGYELLNEPVRSGAPAEPSTISYMI